MQSAGGFARQLGCGTRGWHRRSAPQAPRAGEDTGDVGDAVGGAACAGTTGVGDRVLAFLGLGVGESLIGKRGGKIARFGK